MNALAKTLDPAGMIENDPRWAAVVARDAAADGKFYYSVKTTGVYCRPSCASRPARPENVAFHATRAAAERAGFRPCKRCKPDQPSLIEQHAAKVTEACRLIETAETAPSLETLANHAQLSVYHFHRVFKTITGLTPKAYAAAHRARRVRDELGRSDSVTAAIFDAGYNSNARFYEKSNQLLGMTPTDFRAGGANAQIRFAIGECSLGSILVACSERGVCAILLGDDRGCTRTRSARPVSTRQPDRRRCKVRASRRQGRRFRRGAEARTRSAARCARYRISAARLAGSPRHPGRRNRKLQRDCHTHRRAEIGARSGAGLRGECVSPWRFPAIAWCAMTARCLAIAGESNANARCLNARRGRGAIHRALERVR